MASQSDTDEPVSAELSEPVADSQPPEAAAAPDAGEAVAPVQLGVTRYVHAAFFAGAVLVAYLSGKALLLVWNNLADWPVTAKAVPQLLSYGDSERETGTMITGAAIGVITAVQTYRKEAIRSWAQEVAAELSKVTWPTRETVLNGTIVVIVASAVATIY